ncbi:hypothetical protein ABPG77_009527 [Micractinium sp. CCAP 211/92]
MTSDNSEDEFMSGEDSGSEATSDFDASDSGGSDSEEEGPLQHVPAAKRRRVEDLEGLELVSAGHAVAASAAARATDIDGSEEAEASLLQLEVTELLRDARPDASLEAGLLEVLARLTALLRALPEAKASPAEAASVSGFLLDLAFSPVRPFVFRPPTRVVAVGSFALRAALAPSPAVDLALLMPPACFDNKDQLNHRYHAKRALYLAHLAAALRKHPELGGLSWECLADDPRRPVLVLQPPAGTSQAGFRVRLLPAAPPELCPLHRLGPGRNNLRSAVAAPPKPAPQPAPQQPEAAAAAATGGRHGRKRGKLDKQQAAAQQKQKQAAAAAVAAAAAAAAAAEKQEPQLLPTPHYNTSVLQDLLMLPLAEACRAAAARCPHFSDAAALLRVWARQQQLSTGADALSGCLLTLLLAHLVEAGQAGAAMPAVYLFRSVLVALSSPKTFSGGLFMQRRSPSGTGSASDASPPDAKAWRKAFEVVFVDPSGWLNLAAGVSKAALAQARACATRSLQLLNAGSPEAFDAVFLARSRQAALCDYWFHVQVPEAEAGTAGGDGGQLLRDQPAWRSLEQRVEALATKALGSRARLVRAFRRGIPAACLGGKAPLQKGAPRPQQQHVLLGVQVDPTAALRTLDQGPPADQADAARAFRAFWGAKAELRRFQDGAITEAVVWEEGGPAGRHLIVDSIVSYALQRHLPKGCTVACHAGALDAALRRKHSSLDADTLAARLCEGAAERLGKRLRSLASDSLPLRVVSVQPLAAVLRHAAAFPPLPHLLAGAPRDTLASDHVARCLQPVELLCQLEGSGKWPDHPEAFQKMKAAVGCQLAQLMHQTLGMDAQASEDYVDVLTDGFAFRLLLATERDAAMQQKALQLSGEARLHAEEDMQLRTWHQGAISGIAGENPAFEPAVRLAKRWVGAHLLSPHLGEEAVELLVAHCFASSRQRQAVAGSGGGQGGGPATSAAPAPGSRLSGLLRFLQLLAEHPWRVQPLVVDPDGELSAAQRDAIVRQHGAARAAGGAPAALCLPTPRDHSGAAWTAGRPGAQVLPRIAVLAQRSAAALEQLLLGGGSGSSGTAAGDSSEAAEARAAAAAAAVFSRDLGEYDVVISLRPDALPNAANDLRLGKQAAAAASAPQRPQLGPALQAANQQLMALAEAEAGVKHSRAILKGIPQSVLQARGHSAVRRELLVGFDPLPPYTAQLQRRLGDLAVACADFVGGSVVALKWRAAALAPAPLRPEAAHLACPAGSTQAAPAEELLEARRQGGAAANGTGAGGELSAAVVVPDIVGALSDALALGEGLVESVRLQ